MTALSSLLQGLDLNYTAFLPDIGVL